MNKSLPALAILLTSLCVSQVVSAQSSDSEDPLSSVEKSVEAGPRFDTNVSMNPFYPLLVGGLQGSVSFRIDRSRAIGPVASTLSVLGIRTSTIGVQGQYHLKKKDVMGEGLILDSTLEFLTTTIEFAQESDRSNGALATSSVNWQWMYDNGFNMRLGVGVAVQMAFDDYSDYDNVSEFGSFSLSDSVAGHLFGSGKMSWAF